MQLHIPDSAQEYIRKSNASEWRGMKSDILCQHRNITRGDFKPLATDGILCIVQFLDGTINYIHLENIVFPKDLKAKRTSDSLNASKKQKKPSPCEPLPNTCDELLAKHTRLTQYLESLASI